MQTGKVKNYDGRKGFGFIEPDDGGKEIFVHISALDRAYLGGLRQGQRLQYDVEVDHFGRQTAANLQLI